VHVLCTPKKKNTGFSPNAKKEKEKHMHILFGVPHLLPGTVDDSVS
jgi:hypothetical protein